MAKKNMMLLMAQEMCKRLVAEQTKTRLALGCDAAVIAANRVFHMGPGRAAAFAQAYSEAMNELAGLFLDDATENGDAGIDYAKGKRDQLIRRIVGEDNFIPSMSTLGTKPFVNFTIVLVGGYCTVFFSLEMFNFFNMLKWLECVAGSTILTVALILAADRLFYKKV